MSKLKTYLKKYFIDSMGAMAQGLFASLLIGTIFGTIGKYLGPDYVNSSFVNFIGGCFIELQKYCAGAAGMAIGVAIAYSMKCSPLVVFSSAGVGYLSYSLGAAITAADGSVINYTAGPAGAFFVVIIACEIGMLVSKKTKVDILVTPSVTLISGYIAARIICPAVAYVMYWLGEFIARATGYAPLLMGIVIAVVVGMVLTLPISSAAICAIIFSSAAIEASAYSEALLLAGGAAAVGCCCQMVGFAVASFKENGWGGIVSQGIGTSMLQMGNIVRHPQIWIPATLSGAICGALSTTVFMLQCSGVSAGMGTCGLVGILGILSTSGTSAKVLVGILLLCIVLPGVLSLVFAEIMRKIGWIKEDYMKL